MQKINETIVKQYEEEIANIIWQSHGAPTFEITKIITKELFNAQQAGKINSREKLAICQHINLLHGLNL